jgi:hypothetical protein
MIQRRVLFRDALMEILTLQLFQGRQQPGWLARVDDLEPTKMSPHGGTAGHLSVSDRAARCPIGKVPPWDEPVGSVGWAAVNAVEGASQCSHRAATRSLTLRAPDIILTPGHTRRGA